jgi:uncharacterized protein YkwD
MRRGDRTLLPALLAAVALAGCGNADGGPTASAPATSGDDARIVRTAVTDGRTGDAVTGTDAGPLRELSRGGRPDPSEPRRGTERDGVGAADACPDAEMMPAPDNLARVEAVTLCLLNGVRADNGLSPLSRNAQLANAAAGHATDMVAHSYFAHEGLNGSDIRDRIGATGYLRSDVRWVIGENLAWGTGALATPKSIVNAWMNSEGHRVNILHSEYREIGFGIVAGNPKRPDGFGATYATEFGYRSAPVSTSTPAAGAVKRKAAAKPTAAARRKAAKARRAAQARRAARARQAKQAARAREAKRAPRPKLRRTARRP